MLEIAPAVLLLALLWIFEIFEVPPPLPKRLYDYLRVTPLARRVFVALMMTAVVFISVVILEVDTSRTLTLERTSLPP